MNSCADFAGKSLFTISANGVVATRLIGVKSLTVSNAGFLNVASVAASDTAATRIV